VIGQLSRNDDLTLVILPARVKPQSLVAVIGSPFECSQNKVFAT
jgi:hypothetical protein